MPFVTQPVPSLPPLLLPLPYPVPRLPSQRPQPSSSQTMAPDSPRKRTRPLRRPPPLVIPPPRPITALPTSYYVRGTGASEGEVGVWRDDPRSSAASRKGARRRHNEDRVFHVPSIGLYGICDGHGAADGEPRLTASDKAAEMLPRLITQNSPVKDAFLRCDRAVCATQEKTSFVGTTVTYIQLKARRVLHIVNLGDSRATLIDGSGTPIRLTKDHNPSRRDEYARIRKNGGGVFRGRLNGVLSVSRAIGDMGAKKCMLAIPDETERTLSRDDQLVVLATDGLWDLVSDKDVASLLKEQPLATGSTCVPADLRGAATLLVEKAMSRGSRDDTTVVLIDVRPSSS